MIYLNQIMFKYYENLGICYILYYLDNHQKELKSIQPLFLNPGARLLFVGRSIQSGAVVVVCVMLILVGGCCLWVLIVKRGEVVGDGGVVVVVSHRRPGMCTSVTHFRVPMRYMNSLL